MSNFEGYVCIVGLSEYRSSLASLFLSITTSSIVGSNVSLRSTTADYDDDA